MTKRPPKHPWVWRLCRYLAATVAALLLVAVFYLAVVLGQPQPDEETTAVDMTQPLLTASPAQSVTEESQLNQLIADYPAAVMCFLPGTGPTFQSGLSYDVVYDGGFGRIIELTYRMDSGDTVKVQTMYPARALSLVKRGDYALNTTASVSLSGLRAIRMENKSGIRLHAQSSDAIYVFTAPTMDSEALSVLTKSLQLYTVQQEGT